MLNVYQTSPTLPYSGGVILIAAENRKQAEKFIEDKYSDPTDYSEPKLVNSLHCSGEPGIIMDRCVYS